jgi:hypothetical protein
MVGIMLGGTKGGGRDAVDRVAVTTEASDVEPLPRREDKVG